MYQVIQLNNNNAVILLNYYLLKRNILGVGIFFLNMILMPKINQINLQIIQIH